LDSRFIVTKIRFDVSFNHAVESVPTEFELAGSHPSGSAGASPAIVDGAGEAPALQKERRW
jgi:hypothetical protein